ncbi:MULTISPECIES: YebG family protein [Aeromonas]|uniref:YebG family protein n=1 Tax=Aeromonas TaxID=642 RepID=UPI0032F086D2
MAVEIKYVVVRGGVEKMTFTSKKEADAYDKLLDTADELMTVLATAPVELTPEQQEGLAFYLAEQRDLLQSVLRGGKGQGIPARDEKSEAISADKPKGKSLKSVA